MRKTIILGGGITGLITLHYNKNFILYEASNCVGSDILDDSFPKYVQYCDNLKNLFNELNLKIKKRKFEISIIYNSDEFDFFDESLYFYNKYNIYRDYCNKKYGCLKKNKMNGFLTNNFEKFYIENKKELVDTLYKNNISNIVLNKKAIKIELDKQVIYFDDNTHVEYDRLFSTIPIDVFSSISKLNLTVNKVDVVLFFCKVLSTKHKIFKKNFIYLPGIDFAFHRINILKKEKTLVFEFRDEDDWFDLFNFLKKENIKMKNVDKRKYFFYFINEMPKINNVYFLGRFATGNYEIKINDVIDKVKGFKNE